MASATESRRVFFALAPGDGTRDALADAVEPLLQNPQPRLRWVDRGGWHITLRFVGDIPAGQVADLRNCLTRTAARHHPFPLHLTQIETFPSVQRPLVLAATGASTPAANNLVQDLERGCIDVGLSAEQRPWRCHLTLARVRGRKPLEIDAPTIDIALSAQQLLLMESVPADGARRYQPIASAPLTRNGKGQR